MSDFRSPPTRGGLARRPGDLDNLLSRFFRSEMPDPWPAPPEVQPAPSSKQAQARPWFRHSSRLALAAAVGLFLVGYLALAGRFPASNEPRNSIDNSRPTATDPFRNRHFPPKMHNGVNSGKTQSRSDIQLLQPLIERTPGGHRAESSGYVEGKTIVVNVRQLP